MVKLLMNKLRISDEKFSFGATSAIITNLGLIIGMRTGINPRLGIISGILVIALADNIADSLGIHIYQESECRKTKDVWISTLTNFTTRIIVSLIFILLVMYLPINIAVVVSVVWGLALLSVMSFFIARHRKVNPYIAVAEHMIIAGVVIFGSNLLGSFLIRSFG